MEKFIKFEYNKPGKYNNIAVIRLSSINALEVCGGKENIYRISYIENWSEVTKDKYRIVEINKQTFEKICALLCNS